MSLQGLWLLVALSRGLLYLQQGDTSPMAKSIWWESFEKRQSGTADSSFWSASRHDVDLQVVRTSDIRVEGEQLQVWPVQTLFDERSGPSAQDVVRGRCWEQPPGKKAQRKQLAAKMDGPLCSKTALEQSGKNGWAAEMEGRVKQVPKSGDGWSSLCTDAFAESAKGRSRTRLSRRLRLKESSHIALAAAQQACRVASVDCEEDGKW